MHKTCWWGNLKEKVFLTELGINGKVTQMGLEEIAWESWEWMSVP